MTLTETLRSRLTAELETGMSLQRIARELGVGYATLYDFHREKSRGGGMLLDALVERYGVKVKKG